MGYFIINCYQRLKYNVDNVNKKMVLLPVLRVLVPKLIINMFFRYLYLPQPFQIFAYSRAHAL